MFNKLMSGLGLQGIQIDTRLHNTQLQAGQTLSGEVNCKGTSSNKNINGIHLQLQTSAEVESGDSEFNTSLIIAQWHISGAFELQANQSHRFPFSVQLPFETPLTEVPCRQNKSRVWLHTHLDVDWGLDATDKDFMQILPTTTQQMFIQAMQQCGYNLTTVDTEKGQVPWNGVQATVGCYQELEFKPQGCFRGVNEIEVSFVAEAHQTHVLMEVDRTFRGDGFKSMTIPHNQATVANIVHEIKRLLGI